MEPVVPRFMGWHIPGHTTSGLPMKKLEKMAVLCDVPRVTAENKIVLANRWFQPLTHVSAGGFPRYARVSRQCPSREKRGAQRLAVAHRVAQFVYGVFS